MVLLLLHSIEAATDRETTVASSQVAVRLPCSNQTGGHWWSQYQTVTWTMVDKGTTQSITSNEVCGCMWGISGGDCEYVTMNV